MNIIAKDPSLEIQRDKIKPQKVALIACPWTFFNYVEFVSQQLGLGYVGAYAQQFGHIINAFIDPMIDGGDQIKVPIRTAHQETFRFGHTDEWIIKQVPEDTDFIGINAPFTDSRIVLYELVRKIKRAFPDTLVVVGGILATTLPRQVIEESGTDIVVRGEGEIAFSKILNGFPLEEIPGVVFRKSNGEIFEHSKRSEQLITIDQIPTPGYDFRPMEKYVQWSPRGNKGDRTLSIISSRGCPFSCQFCSIPEKGQKWRPFTPERVLEEIQFSIDEWGVNRIEFEDDNFTLMEPRALAILEYLRDIRQDGYDIQCSFPNGIMIDKMTQSLASLLKDSGTEIAYLPVESGDLRTLISMDKPMAEQHLKQSLRVAKWCVDADLQVSCFFIVGYPGGKLSSKYTRSEEILSRYNEYLIRDESGIYMIGEDRESFENTLTFCQALLDLGVQGITPLIATPYPGTEMYKTCERFGWLAFPDNRNVLTTISYAALDPGLIQIETPWCSRKETYARWQEMMDIFPTLHNVRKEGDSVNLLSGDEIRNQ